MARSKRILEAALCVALFAGCAGAVVAQDVASAVSARQAAMKAVGAAAGQMRASGGDPAVLKAAGKTINDNLKVFAANLPAGSGPDSGQTTKAKAEIWSDAAGFKTAMDAALTASAALAESGDPAGAQAIGRTCAGCHTGYRS